jgi:hypothetical protein
MLGTFMKTFRATCLAGIFAVVSGGVACSASVDEQSASRIALKSVEDAGGNTAGATASATLGTGDPKDLKLAFTKDAEMELQSKLRPAKYWVVTIRGGDASAPWSTVVLIDRETGDKIPLPGR